MKLCTTSFDSAADRHVARASWPLPEPALAYFPNVRSALSDRDLGAGALIKEVAMSDNSGAPGASQAHGHIPVLLNRQRADGEGAVLIDATLGAGGHAERFLPSCRACG